MRIEKEGFISLQPHESMCTKEDLSKSAHDKSFNQPVGSGSFLIGEQWHLSKDISDSKLNAICGHVAGSKDKNFKPVFETQFELNVVPQELIIKLGEKEHIDAFFKHGTLQLGSYEYYNTFDHTEIGDDQEGIVTLAARGEGDSGCIVVKCGSGFNQYIFCAFIGNPDCETMRNFGYDSGFIINDPIGFSNAITESISASSSTFGKCVYHPHKAILGFPKEPINGDRLSHETGKIVNAAQHFIKPECYSHQKEFRFLWEQSLDISGTKIFDCPSARQYCSPLTKVGIDRNQSK